MHARSACRRICDDSDIDDDCNLRASPSTAARAAERPERRSAMASSITIAPQQSTLIGRRATAQLDRVVPGR